jgi:phospholipid/cholesterol/gamma-HCH transport system permease protein
MQFIEYFQKLIAALKLSDIIVCLVKSLVFGIIISTVATYNAFKVRVASTEIPQVVIKAVGQGFVLCIVANVIITLLFYILTSG